MILKFDALSEKWEEVAEMKQKRYQHAMLAVDRELVEPLCKKI